MIGRRLVLGVLLAAGAAPTSPAQKLPPRAPIATLSWSNGSFMLYAGLQTVEMTVWPSALMRQRKLADGELRIAMPRDSVHGWTGDVRYLIGEKRPDPTAAFADWGAVLRGRARGSLLMAGQDPRAPRVEPPFYLLARSTASDEPLTFRVQKWELLRLLDVVDSLADAPPSDFGWNVVLPSDTARDTTAPGTGIEVIAFGRLKMPKGRMSPGQVRLQYIVGSSGTVDSANIRVAYSDGDDFTRSAVRAILDSRFKPATLNGRPVPQLVNQRLAFFFSGPDDD